MQPAPIPINEESRLKELYSFNILDSDPENDYTALTELAAYVCGCPIASITFIDKDRQWFKAQKNMLNKEGSRADSFCGHAIMQKEVMVVNNAPEDERFFDNPDVVGGLKIGFYAGAPIISSSGYMLGTVCAIDNSPKQLSQAQLKALKTIAAQVSRLLDLRTKNERILKTSGELVQAEKQVAKLNISEREKQNTDTAYLLHEKIAQTLVAIKFNISFARNAKDLADHFLETSIREIESLTNTITDLSRSITPTTYSRDNYAAHIAQMLDSFSTENNITIKYKHAPDLSCLHGDMGLMVFRIIQDELKYLLYDHAEKISLNLKTGKKLSIILKYTVSAHKIITDPKRKMLEANITNRVAMLNGKIVFSAGKEKHAIIKIAIPIP